jgi:hypothetical protein
MPCGDVLSRVHIRVGGISAGCTGEDRLALAVPARNMPARAAALTGVCGVDLLDPAGCLLFQPLDQDPSAGGENLPIQPGLGVHVVPGFGNGPLR